MKSLKIVDDIYVLSTSVSDILFEEMWEIPNGVSLNSYLVKGEESTAIIDGFCDWDGVPETLFELLGNIDVKPEDINYAIINHMEPDHTGWIKAFSEINDHFKIYTNKKAAEILNHFYGIVDNVEVVKEGDTIDLGGGKVISFHMAPNVHWPDTMMSLEESTKTLFTCDFYGSFGSLDKTVFADELSAEEKELIVDEEIRYYSNVLGTFNAAAKKALIKSKSLEPKVIAPGHGPIYRDNPSEVIDRYEAITKFYDGEALEEVAILWGSMYGMTEKAVGLAKEELDKMGVKYHDLHVPYVHSGEILSKVCRSKYLIIAAPTYEFNLLPSVVHELDEIARKKIDNKKCIYFGSFGWASKATKELEKLVEEYKMNWDIKEMIQFKGSLEDENKTKIADAIKILINE